MPTNRMIAIIKVVLVFLLPVLTKAVSQDLLKLELVAVNFNEELGLGVAKVSQINAGKICIGTPCQNFTVMLDTGSSDLWVSSTRCTSASCGKQHRYDEGKSSTHRRLKGNFSIVYGTGNLEGIFSEETVKIAGVEVKKQKFGQAVTSASTFANAGLDGILGLGFKGLARGKSTPVFYSMVAQKAVKSPVFTFCRSGSHDKNKVNELILGASDPSRYPGKTMTYVPVIGNTYWKFQLDKISIGDDDSVCPDGCAAVADSGTTTIRGPKGIIEAINGVLGARLYKSNQYQLDCNREKYPPIDFVIGGESFTLEPKDYILQINRKTCVSAFSVSQTKSANFLILGGIFLNGKCTMYNLGMKRLGFVSL